MSCLNILYPHSHNTGRYIEPYVLSVAADLRARLSAWMRSTNDPFLSGPVPAPPGALVNRANGVSPEEPPERM